MSSLSPSSSTLSPLSLHDALPIFIDSKVALNAYDRAVGAESPEEYQLAMSEHVKAVRKHIDDLASKDYTNLVGMRSPSFVLMFRSEEHTSELQSRGHLVCRLLLEKKTTKHNRIKQ